MSFLLTSDITIGPFVRVKVNQITIKKSVSQFVDKATILMPTSARIKMGETVNDLAPVAKSFSEGAKVIINLGYNGQLKHEFTGFISRVNFKSPLEVECEGYSYQLRKRTYKRVFKQTKLVEILKFLAQGTDIIVREENVAKVEVTRLLLQDHSGTEALQLIKKMFNDLILIWFDNNVLHARVFPIEPIGPIVKYRVGANVINADDLKKREAVNQDVEVIYQARDQAGMVKVATGGRLKAWKTITSSSSQTPGERKRINTTITHQPTLNALAKSNHFKLTYDGYDGKITCFIQPFVLPAWAIQMEDRKFPERGGKYIVNAIEVRYGLTGARRILELGNKLT